MTAPSFRFVNPGRPTSPAALVLPVVERLLAALDQENDEIGRRAPIDYRANNLRKSQALLELNRLLPAIAGGVPSAAIVGALAELQERLEVNRRLLNTELKAARAVSDTIARAIRDCQSDGTYSARYWADDK